MVLSEPTNPALYHATCQCKRLAHLMVDPAPHHWQLSGRVSGRPGERKLHYLGSGDSLSYLRQLHFDGACSTRALPLGHARLRQTAQRLAADGAFVIIEVNRALGASCSDLGYLSFPWLRQRVALRGERYRARCAKVEATVGRRVHRERFSFDLTRAPGDVERFCQDLYLPYVARRYGAACHPRSRRALRAASRAGFVLRVFDGGRWVSGAVCRRSRDEISLLGFGLAQPHEDLLRKGALSAVYYFLFKWAESRGLGSIDLLRSRPHTSDGVYEHKRRWGAAEERDAWPHTLWRLLPPPGDEDDELIGGHLVWDGSRFSPLGSLRTSAPPVSG